MLKKLFVASVLCLSLVVNVEAKEEKAKYAKCETVFMASVMTNRCVYKSTVCMVVFNGNAIPVSVNCHQK